MHVHENALGEIGEHVEPEHRSVGVRQGSVGAIQEEDVATLELGEEADVEPFDG